MGPERRLKGGNGQQKVDPRTFIFDPAPGPANEQHTWPNPCLTKPS